MNLSEPLLAELKVEAANTRKMLERIPAGKNDWKPHEKSTSLGDLASHIGALLTWLSLTIEQPELDFDNYDYRPGVFNTTEDLLRFYDDNLAKGTAALQSASNEKLTANWKLRKGERVFFDMPRIAVIRSFVLNHMIHHRGQLSVYLRLLDVPLPGVYGPTADEPM